jgi:TM2 domain-containing membrane protein YozV
MAKVLDVLPELTGEEMLFVQNLINDWPDEKAKSFATVYRARRKEPQLILFTTLLGFIIIAGVQRFVIGQIGMGILYLFTGGLCLIGTIVDLVNYQRLAFESNEKTAREVAALVR